MAGNLELLKLAALDADDLAVISAHLQDAVVKVSDLAYRPREHRFALLANRFDWEALPGGEPRRRRAGFQVARVLGAKISGFDPARGDAVLNLLGIAFTPAEAPAGALMLTFSGGAAIRLDVECIEAGLRDLGPVWAAASVPAHDLDAA